MFYGISNIHSYDVAKIKQVLTNTNIISPLIALNFYALINL